MSLIASSETGNLELVRLLLKCGASADSTHFSGTTALMTACAHGRVGVAALLLNYGARIDMTGPDGATALTFACQEGHIAVTELLLQRGANADVTRDNGSTALMAACFRGHTRVADLLLNEGVAVDAIRNDGVTALMRACYNGHREVAKLLLEHGASVDMTRDSGSTALMLACQNGHTALIDLLLEHGAQVDFIRPDGGTALMWACERGYDSVAEALLKHEASVTMTRPDGSTALIIACQHGSTGVILLLLDYGADVEVARPDGFTALMAASGKGHRDAAELLLNYGATTGTTRPDGLTAFMLACQSGHVDVAELLVARGVNVNSTRPNGVTALMMASIEGRTSEAELLLKQGANIDAAGPDGVTSLMLACQSGHTDLAQLLLARGADVNATKCSGVAVLRKGNQADHSEVIEQSRNRGAGVDMLSGSGASLIVSRQDGHTSVVELLSIDVAPLNEANDGGTTALMLACRKGHSQVVDVLLSNSASVHAANEQNETALLVAIASGHFELSRILLNAGASVHVRAASGETPFTGAARWNHLETIKILSDAGYSARWNSSSLPAPLFPSTFQTLHKYGVQAHEFEVMWSCAVKRLTNIYAHLEHDESLPQSTFHQFGMILARLIKLHAKCETTSVFTRLVMSRSIVSRFEDLHGEIDALIRGSAFCNFEAEGGSGWRVTWKSEVARLLAIFESSLADDQVVSQCLRSELDQAEVLSLLQNELQVRSDLCSPGLRKLLQSAYQIALRCSSIPVAEPPRWLLPDHEIDLDAAEAIAISKNSVVLLRGKWLNSIVTVRQLRVPVEDFVTEIERWFSLSHPNVIKIFGASHLRAPFLAIFENVLSANLREYLSLDADRHLVWTKLHEVALGVKYLHERGVVFGNLQCSNIWIGTDGLAKIAGLEAGASVEHPARVRWMAPECLRSQSHSAESDIYSLGMCIVEAMSGDIPWSGKRDELIANLVTYGHYPQLPNDIEASQACFIRSMWQFDPSSRPTIAIVVEQLKAFAEQSAPSPHFANTLSSNVEEFVFPELESTIPEFLQWLKSKCDLCHDASASVSYIYKRLAAIYNTMTATETRSRPSDVQVVKFCEVLARFHSQLEIATSENSVLQFAKSLKVALVTDLFHKQIDDVLALLPGVDLGDPIHEWRQQAESHRQSDIGTAYRDSLGKTGQVLDNADQPVNLVEQESEGLNRNFQRVGLNLDNSETKKQWSIPLDKLKYDKKQEIGKGAFGSVYKASWLGTPVVVKYMGYEEDGDESHRRLFFHELRIWYPLNHPNVVKLYGAGDIGKRYFVCEFAGNGALLAYLKKDSNQKKTWRKLHEVAQGLAYLHEQNVVHNDLKCDNFLVGSDDRAKIIDFGLSCIPNVVQVQITTKGQGAVQWRSPEYLRGEKSTLASDVYAFGMCILEAVMGSPPWGMVNDAGVRFQVVRQGRFPLRPDVLKDDSQWQLIKRMGAKEPSERPGMTSVVERLEEFAQQEKQSETTMMTMKRSAVPGIP